MGHATEFGPGDIGAIAKLKETHSGDVLSGKDASISFPPIELPAAVMAFSIEPKSKGDEEKVVRRRFAGSRKRTRRSTSTATRRPASRSSPGCRRCTSR